MYSYGERVATDTVDSCEPFVRRAEIDALFLNVCNDRRQRCQIAVHVRNDRDAHICLGRDAVTSLDSFNVDEFASGGQTV